MVPIELMDWIELCDGIAVMSDCFNRLTAQPIWRTDPKIYFDDFEKILNEQPTLDKSEIFPARRFLTDHGTFLSFDFNVNENLRALRDKLSSNRLLNEAFWSERLLEDVAGYGISFRQMLSAEYSGRVREFENINNSIVHRDTKLSDYLQNAITWRSSQINIQLTDRVAQGIDKASENTQAVAGFTETSNKLLVKSNELAKNIERLTLIVLVVSAFAILASLLTDTMKESWYGHYLHSATEREDRYPPPPAPPLSPASPPDAASHRAPPPITTNPSTPAPGGSKITTKSTPSRH